MARLPIDLYVNLLREGYTPDEIRNYSNGAGETPNNPTPAPETPNNPAAPENPNNPAPSAPETPNNPAPETPNNENAALLAEMRQLVAMMRNANIRDINMPTDTAPDAAQVMATILAPRANNEGV